MSRTAMKGARRGRPSNKSKEVLSGLGPVALTWAIAKSMPRASRGEILKACVDAGINERTAAGQVQEYLHTMRALQSEHSQARERRQQQEANSKTRRARGRSVGIPVHVEPEVRRGRHASKRGRSGSEHRTNA